MQLETLHYFLDLVETGSFYKAAKKAHLSQQGMNKAITSLENELGVKLVERGRRGVRPTEQGEVLATHARRIIDDYHRMLADLFHSAPASNGSSEQRITIYASYYPAQVAASLLREMDILQFANFIEVPYKKMQALVDDSDGSALFLTDVFPQNLARLKEQSELVFEPLLTTRYGIVWKEGSPLAGNQTIHRAQLAEIPLATNVQKDMAKFTDQLFQGFEEPNIVLGASNPHATLEYALTSTDGAATFDSFGFTLAQRNPRVDTGSLNFTPLSTPKALCHLGFIYPKSARPAPRARFTIDLISSWLHEHYADYFHEYPADYDL